VAEVEWVQLPPGEGSRPAWQASGAADVYLLDGLGGRLMLTRWRPGPNQSAADVARQAAANASDVESHGFAWRVAQQYEDGGSEPFRPAWQHDQAGGLLVTSVRTED
jgi:hypothetical protein